MFLKLKFRTVESSEAEKQFSDNRFKRPNTTLMKKFSKN